MNELKYETLNIKKDVFQPIINLQGVLSENIDKLQQLLNLPSEHQDVRLVTLKAIKDILVQFGWTFAAIFISMKDETFNSWQELIANKSVDKKTAQINMYDYLRRSLIIALHFNIDNMFRALLTEINDLPKGLGFRAYAGRLRERTKSSNEDFKVIMALTYMRNCFHNNGIHKDKELHIELENYEISFIPNQDVDYSLGRIFTILKVAIPVVCNWLFKPPLSDLTHIIQDPGALAASK